LVDVTYISAVENNPSAFLSRQGQGKKLVAVLEMTRSKGLRDGPLQFPRDRVLWILTNSGGKMDRSKLRRCAEMRYTLLDPFLKELARCKVLEA
jgi:hypothetical protein